MHPLLPSMGIPCCQWGLFLLVTTKMGKESKVSVSYNGYVGFNRATALPKYVDSWDYARPLNQADGITRFTDEEIQAMRTGSQPDVWPTRSSSMIFFR